MDEGYSQRRVARILRVGRGQVQSWSRTGVVGPRRPEARSGGYSFEDLVGLRTALALVSHGLPARALRRGVKALQSLFPGVANPFSQCNPMVFQRRLIVRWEGHLLEAESGQLLLNQVVVQGGTTSVSVIAPHEEQASAWEWFRRGLLYDRDPSTYHLAIEAYGRAIAACPQFAEAYVNQGNVWFNLGALAEAERSYRRAAGVHPHYAPAYFNLGNVLEEEGRGDEAVAAYTKAIELDSTFADAHFNLAALFEKLSAHDEALREWRRYLELDPDSPWAEAARERLAAQRRREAAEREGATPLEVLEGGGGGAPPTSHNAFDHKR